MARTNTRVTMPAFIADHNSIQLLGSGRQIDWSAVNDAQRAVPGFVVTTTALAAAAATSIAVVALPGALVAGQLLDFTGAGEVAVVAAPGAAAGATSVPVEALDAAVENGDTAIVAGSGKKRLPAGTVVREVTAGGKLAPNGAGATPVGILATDAEEDHPAHAASGYGVIVKGVIYSNLLPTLVNETNVVTNLNTGRFVFQTYADNRGT
jgi:hypothetical protein